MSHCIHYSKPGNRWGSRNTNSRSLKPSASKVVQFGLLLHNLRHCEATDARDKVYAFLGLSPKPLPMLQADYSASVEDLYTDVATAILGSGDLEALSLLYFVQISDNNNGNTPQPAKLPSWVPDWRHKAKMVILGMSNTVRATGNAQHPVVSFPNQQSIAILGVRLYHITHMTRFVEYASTVFQAETFSVQGSDAVQRWVNDQPKDKVSCQQSAICRSLQNASPGRLEHLYTTLAKAASSYETSKSNNAQYYACTDKHLEWAGTQTWSRSRSDQR